MKITSVDPIHISVPYDYGGPLQKADAIPWRNMETLFVKVTTDEGITGWGEGFGFAICGTTRYAVEHMIAPLVVGRDPADITALVTDIAKKQHTGGRNGPLSFAISALDIALWDIAGKVAGKPLYQLLGGSERIERMPAYASLLRYGSVDLVERHAAAAVQRGYKRVKLHEIKTPEVAIARKAIGPGIALMVDTNCPWTVDEAIDMAKSFAPHDLLWLEEPVWPPEDYAGQARVRAEGGVPVAAGENAGTFADIVQLIGTAKVDYVQPSVTKIGGVSQMLRTFEYARAHGAKVAPHSPYFGPGLIATIHISASTPEKPPIERFYLELAASPLGDFVNAREGEMRVPQGPGLGVDVDEAVLEKYRVK
jgi:D-galactarolactone cycloisomerase